MDVIDDYLQQCRKITDTVKRKNKHYNRRHSFLPVPYLQEEWCMYSAQAIAALWWKKCGQGMVHFPALILLLNCRSPFITW